MRFSALLPTRNRLQYLRFAVESVLRQDDPDWELVVSDNDSEDDIAGYVASLGDDRVRYVRTDSFVPVTENWNNALRHSTGDYFVMLGDDDALLPGYFSAMRRHVERFAAPGRRLHERDALRLSGRRPRPRRAATCSPTATRASCAARREPFVLDPAVARRAVRQAMDFRVRYGFNMQFALVSRRLADRIAGGTDGEFFRSPFPDYFAMNMVMLRAAPLVVDPRAARGDRRDPALVRVLPRQPARGRGALVPGGRSPRRAAPRPTGCFPARTSTTAGCARWRR